MPARPMRILLTGVSSFTGAWFAKALHAAGMEVIAACRGRVADYDRPRRRRIEWLGGRCRIVEASPFGSNPFIDLIRHAGPFDLLCHHGAEVGDHRRADLDVLAAAAANTHRIEPVLDRLTAGGCRAVLVTGTVFEADEGWGEAPLRAFSPYGRAKTLTWQIFRHHAEARGLTLGKFVVASPFGPFEKPNLPRYLVESWRRGEQPVLRHPYLVRDHIQVQLLATAYARFAGSLPGRSGVHRLTPSQFAERLDTFAARLAAAMTPRTGWPCRFACAVPPEPSDEPRERCGTTPVTQLVDAESVTRAWNEHAGHYQTILA